MPQALRTLPRRADETQDALRVETPRGTAHLSHSAAAYHDWRDNALYGVSINGGTPIAGWFLRENSIKIADLGVPLFQETTI